MVPFPRSVRGRWAGGPLPAERRCRREAGGPRPRGAAEAAPYQPSLPPAVPPPSGRLGCWQRCSLRRPAQVVPAVAEWVSRVVRTAPIVAQDARGGHRNPVRCRSRPSISCRSTLGPRFRSCRVVAGGSRQPVPWCSRPWRRLAEWPPCPWQHLAVPARWNDASTWLGQRANPGMAHEIAVRMATTSWAGTPNTRAQKSAESGVRVRSVRSTPTIWSRLKRLRIQAAASSSAYSSTRRIVQRGQAAGSNCSTATSQNSQCKCLGTVAVASYRDLPSTSTRAFRCSGVMSVLAARRRVYTCLIHPGLLVEASAPTATPTQQTYARYK